MRKRQAMRLGPTVRKWLIVLHMVLGIGWMGADIALCVLLMKGRTTADAIEAISSYTAVALIVPPVVPVLSIGILLTGLLLGWGTSWGLTRYWWVFIKLVLSVAMTAMVYIGLLPTVHSLPAIAHLASADAVRAALGPLTIQLMFPPTISFALLCVATALSIFKPKKPTPWSKSR